MRLDLEADICVVGAGPAGLALAGQLSAHGLDIVVLESGDHRSGAEAQLLNRGRVVGQPYKGLQATRHRGVGGTAGIWNTFLEGSPAAKYAALDPVDLEPRSGQPLAGWPLRWAELASYYPRAAKCCGLDSACFEADDPLADRHGPLDFGRSPVTSRVYRLATRPALLAETLDAVRASSTARMVTNATVLRLETDGTHRVARAIAVGPDGETGVVRAGRFVLAGGAVENARLLLVSSRGGVGLGNDTGWVGRCFMEHARDTAVSVVPVVKDFYGRTGFYDLQASGDGSAVLGRLALLGDAVRDTTSLNASGTLLPIVRSRLARVRHALGPFGRTSIASKLLPSGGHGWSKHPRPHLAFEGMTLLINAEQSPDPDNRIRLGDQLDPLGVPEPELHWRWTDADQAGLEKIRELFADALEGTGLVSVRLDRNARVDLNAHHHAGTTRMHMSPDEGVVDPDCRVHGVDNLYVAGASVLPTVGFANPTLTIVALALRLADHLTGARADTPGTGR